MRPVRGRFDDALQRIKRKGTKGSRIPCTGTNKFQVRQPPVPQWSALSRAKRRVATRLAREVWPPEYSGAALIPLGAGRGVESAVLGRTGARLRLGIGEFDHSQGL